MYHVMAKDVVCCVMILGSVSPCIPTQATLSYSVSYPSEWLQVAGFPPPLPAGPTYQNCRSHPCTLLCCILVSMGTYLGWHYRSGRQGNVSVISFKRCVVSISQINVTLHQSGWNNSKRHPSWGRNVHRCLLYVYFVLCIKWSLISTMVAVVNEHSQLILMQGPLPGLPTHCVQLFYTPHTADVGWITLFSWDAGRQGNYVHCTLVLVSLLYIPPCIILVSSAASFQHLIYQSTNQLGLRNILTLNVSVAWLLAMWPLILLAGSLCFGSTL